MLVDVLSVSVRALSFVFALQAAGIAIFVGVFGVELADARGSAGAHSSIRHLGAVSGLLAAVLVIAHYALESARMAGELAGVWDFSLQKFVATSSTATAAGARILGLMFVVVSLRGSARSSPWAWLGAVLIAASFAATGHTSSHPHRWILSGLLLLHLLVIEFWFGALLPLILVTLRTPQLAARIVARFSRIATALVPLILVAGLAMAWLLVPDLKVLREPYGQLLLTKGAGFAVLLALASINKWMLGPALQTPNVASVRSFRRSVSVEYALIVAVLAVTAVMTSFYSPES